MKWLKQWVHHPRHSSLRLRARLTLERLETRVVPYTTSGGAWPNPHLVTISFVPDGTDQGGVSSNLFATLNAHPGWTTATWQNQILKAAQAWAQQTNINFAVVSDNGTGIGGGPYEQGDPGMGDIRIGGYNFGFGALAGAEYPPQVNNYSVAGDIDFNTGVGWNITTAYDLFSVAMHEMGHAIGMGESTSYGSVMQGAYAWHNGLSNDDITGIHTVYGGARAYDSYYGAPTPNNSFATAADVSSSINPMTLAAVVNPLDITTTAVKEYFKFTVPSGSQSSFTVTVQSSGLSLLAPTLSVYNSSQVLVGTVSGAGHYGTTITYTVTGASPGQTYYVKVGGADTTAFGTGAYGLVLNFGTLPAPTVASPTVAILAGFPLQDGGGDAEVAGNNNTADVPNPVTPAPKPPVQSLAFVVVSSNQVGPGAGQTLATTLVTAPLAPQTTLVASPQAAAAQAAAGSRIDSGKAQDNGQTIVDESDDVTPPLLNPDSMPAASGVPADAVNLLEAPAGSLGWRDASTACFTDDTLARTTATSSESTEDAPAGGVALNHAAAATCLMVLLGSYWHATPQEATQGKRRLSQIRPA